MTHYYKGAFSDLNPSPYDDTEDDIRTEPGVWQNSGDLVPEDDPINPAHYQGFTGGAGVCDIAEHLSYNRGNAVKYMSRAGVKDPAKELDDLEKARWYVEREITLYKTRNGIK